MKRTATIQIPTPCHERWEAMHPAKNGRFCDSCAKNVVDFTAMSDAQIFEHFKNSTGNLCGRFTNTQLNRPLVYEVPPKSNTFNLYAWLFRAAVAVGLLAQTPSCGTNSETIGEIKPSIESVEAPPTLGAPIVNDTIQSSKSKDSTVSKESSYKE